MPTSSYLLIQCTSIAKFIEEVEIVYCLQYLDELHNVGRVDFG
jgi:hypothetical protein